MTQSLAQWLASKGGNRMDDPVLGGEVQELRELNTHLRGRNAIVRRRGLALDVLALDAMEAGYPVLDVQDLLDAVLRDGWAIVTGDQSRRIYRYDDDQAWDGAMDGAAFWEGYGEWLRQQQKTDLHSEISRSESNTHAGAASTVTSAGASFPNVVYFAPPPITVSGWPGELKYSPGYSPLAGDSDFFVEAEWVDLDLAA